MDTVSSLDSEDLHLTDSHTISSMDMGEPERQPRKPMSLPFPSMQQTEQQEALHDSDLLHPQTIIAKFQLTEEWEALDSMKKCMQLFVSEGEYELMSLIATHKSERALDKLSVLTNTFHDKLSMVEKSYHQKEHDVISLQRQCNLQRREIEALKQLTNYSTTANIGSTSTSGSNSVQTNASLWEDAAHMITTLELERSTLEQHLREVSAQHAIHISDMQQKIDDLEFQVELAKEHHLKQNLSASAYSLTTTGNIADLKTPEQVDRKRVNPATPSSRVSVSTEATAAHPNPVAEIAELKSQRRILLHHLKNLDKELQASKNTRAEEVQELEALRETMSDVMAELRYRSEGFEDLQAAHHHLQSEHEALLVHLSNAQQLLQQQVEQDAKLQAEVSKTEMLMQGMQALESQVVQLTEQQQTAEQDHQQLQTVLLLAQTELEEERSRHQEVLIKLQHTEQQLNTLLEEYLPAKCADYSPTKYVEEKKGDVNVIQQEEEDKQKEAQRGKFLDKLVRQNSKLMNQLSETDGKIRSTESELHRLRRELTEFRYKYEGAQVKLKQYHETHQAVADHQKECNSNDDDDNAEEKTEAVNLAGDMEELWQLASRSQPQSPQQLEQSIPFENIPPDDVNSVLDEQPDSEAEDEEDDELSALQDEVRRLRQQHDLERHHHAQLVRQLEESQTALQHASAEKTEMNQELTQLRKDMDAMKMEKQLFCHLLWELQVEVNFEAEAEVNWLDCLRTIEEELIQRRSGLNTDSSNHSDAMQTSFESPSNKRRLSQGTLEKIEEENSDADSSSSNEDQFDASLTPTSRHRRRYSDATDMSKEVDVEMVYGAKDVEDEMEEMCNLRDIAEESSHHQQHKNATLLTEEKARMYAEYHDLQQQLHDEMAAKAQLEVKVQELEAALNAKDDACRALQEEVARAEQALQESLANAASKAQAAEESQSVHNNSMPTTAAAAAGVVVIAGLDQLSEERQELIVAMKELDDLTAHQSTELDTVDKIANRSRSGTTSSTHTTPKKKMAINVDYSPRMEDISIIDSAPTPSGESQQSLHDRVLALQSEVQQLQHSKHSLEEEVSVLRAAAAISCATPMSSASRSTTAYSTPKRSAINLLEVSREEEENTDNFNALINNVKDKIQNLRNVRSSFEDLPTGATIEGGDGEEDDDEEEKEDDDAAAEEAKEIELLRLKVQQLEEDKLALKEDKERLQNQVETWKQKYQDVKDALETSQEALEDQQAEMQKLSAQLTQLRQQLQKAQEAISSVPSTPSYNTLSDSQLQVDYDLFMRQLAALGLQASSLPDALLIIFGNQDCLTQMDTKSWRMPVVYNLTLQIQALEYVRNNQQDLLSHYHNWEHMREALTQDMRRELAISLREHQNDPGYLVEQLIDCRVNYANVCHELDELKLFLQKQASNASAKGVGGRRRTASSSIGAGVLPATGLSSSKL